MLERRPRHGKTVFAISLALVAATGALAFDCEVPLFVQQGSLDANVMILLDSSGSMNSVVYHSDYDPGATYVGPFDETRDYYIWSEGEYRDWDISGHPGGMTGTTAIWAIRGTDGPGRYIGNYLNWLFYHADDTQRSWTYTNSICRMQVARLVVREIIERSQRVRFGLMCFNFDDGGDLRAPIGTDQDDIIAEVMATAANDWTPLAESMEDVLDYFKGGSSPIIAECQKNFLIVLTDGYPTKDLAVSSYLHDWDGDGNDPGTCSSMGAPDPDSNDCSDHMDDIAGYMAHEDINSDFPGDQHVVTYTIGFGVDASILQDTADNGDGLYFLADSAVDLWTSLELVMLDIISRISTGAAVAVVSTERGYEDRLYRGKFMPGTWHGYLESFNLPYENGDSPVWEAGYLLANRDADDRAIFTAVGPNRMNFDVGQVASLMGPMGIGDLTTAGEVIEWTRGVDVLGYRPRDDWKLGDIIHSTPVVVGKPANFDPDPSYQTFMTSHEYRSKMVYVGANDGMLHAFDASNGHEAWAFIPEFSLPKLASVADSNYCHEYSVDLTPVVRDVKIGSDWHTLLVGGGRQGGAGYFALDVTYPFSPEFLWQVELPLDVPFASEVEFAVVEDRTLALIGTGLDESSGRSQLEVYDVETGEHLGDLNGSVVLPGSPLARNRTTGASAVDLDLDGEHDVCYVANLQGQLFRISFEGTANPASWQVTRLWHTPHEITARPVAAYGENGEVYVYVGTGAYLDTDDVVATDPNVFACIIDRHDLREDLSPVCQTGAIQDMTGAEGWYVDLVEASGERVTEPAVVVADAVFFTSFMPSTDLCSAGGASWLYRMDYSDGSAPDDGESDDWNSDRVISLDEGVASRPVVDVVNETVIVQSSDATIRVQEIGQQYFHLIVRNWQETFDFVVTP